MASLKEKLEAAGMRLALAKSEVQAAQSEWDSLYRQVEGRRMRRAAPQPDESPKLPGIANGNGTSASLPHRVEKHLRDNPGPQQYRAIAAALDAQPATIRATLNILKDRGIVEKAGRGLWKLADEKATPPGGTEGRHDRNLEG